MEGLTLSPSFILLAGAATIFAGISKGGFGSGAAFVSSALLALVIPPGQALALMLPLLMVMDIASLKPYWRKWDWPRSRLLILSGVPGVFLGVLFFQAVDDDALRILIGVISIGFVVWQIAWKIGSRLKFQRSLGVVGGSIAGVLAGFSSFVSHAGGPPAAVYLLSNGMSKTQYQASTVLVFWVINIAKFVPYAWLGLITVNGLWANLFLVPVALLGTWIGVRLHYVISDAHFFFVTYVLLVFTGTNLIWGGLT